MPTVTALNSYPGLSGYTSLNPPSLNGRTGDLRYGAITFYCAKRRRKTFSCDWAAQFWRWGISGRANNENYAVVDRFQGMFTELVAEQQSGLLER